MAEPTSTRAKLPTHTPVVIVGAGYAGLTAALRLHDHGVPALVLEAADRSGGRVCSQPMPDGTVLDHGGQWVGPTQEHLLAMADRFGCATFPTWEAGASLELWHDGTIRSFTGSCPEDAPGVAEYHEALTTLDKLAARVNPRDPAHSTDAEDWDSETVEAYFRRTIQSTHARRRLALAVQGVFTMEPREISLLHLLFYVASAGGFDQLMDTGGGAQDARFVAGAQAPALAIADHLSEFIMLDTEVEALEQSQNHAAVHSRIGTVHADRVIVATPPPATNRIRFLPDLPVPRKRWLQRSVMGDVAKIHVRYERPFWRDDGLSGIATLYGAEPVGIVFDNSPNDGDHGVLVVFVYGDRLRRWSLLPSRERRAQILHSLAQLFGKRAHEPFDYHEKLWPEDRWVDGGYAANPSPGAWIAHGHAGWRSPSGRIHWAGSETSERWNGYINGAIASGERAADEVLRTDTLI